MLAHENFALKDARRLIMQDMFEKLAALAVRHGVVDNKRRIRVLLSRQQRSAGQGYFGVLAMQARKNLAAQHGAIGDHSRRRELRALPQLDNQAGDMRLRLMVLRDENMLNARARSEVENQRIVALGCLAGRMALNAFQ